MTIPLSNLDLFRSPDEQRYVNLLIIQLARNGGGIFEFSQSQALPQLKVDPSAPIPSFNHFVCEIQRISQAKENPSNELFIGEADLIISVTENDILPFHLKTQIDANYRGNIDVKAVSP